VLKKYNTVLKWFSTSYEIQPLLLSTWISHLHRYPVMKCINHSLIRYQRVVCQFHATSFWVVNVLRGGEENTCLELLGWEGGVHSPYIILNGWCQGDHQSRQKNKRVGQFTKLVTTDNNLNRHPSNCYELIMRNFLVFNLSTTRQYFFFSEWILQKKKNSYIHNVLFFKKKFCPSQTKSSILLLRVLWFFHKSQLVTIIIIIEDRPVFLYFIYMVKWLTCHLSPIF
jgi:hypothetical protein